MSGIALLGGGSALILVPPKASKVGVYSRFKHSTLHVYRSTYFHRKWDQDKQNSALDSTVSGLDNLSLALG